MSLYAILLFKGLVGGMATERMELITIGGQQFQLPFTAADSERRHRYFKEKLYEQDPMVLGADRGPLKSNGSWLNDVVENQTGGADGQLSVRYVLEGTSYVEANRTQDAIDGHGSIYISLVTVQLKIPASDAQMQTIRSFVDSYMKSSSFLSHGYGPLETEGVLHFAEFMGSTNPNIFGDILRKVITTLLGVGDSYLDNAFWNGTKEYRATPIVINGVHKGYQFLKNGETVLFEIKGDESDPTQFLNMRTAPLLFGKELHGAEDMTESEKAIESARLGSVRSSSLKSSIQTLKSELHLLQSRQGSRIQGNAMSLSTKSEELQILQKQYETLKKSIRLNGGNPTRLVGHTDVTVPETNVIPVGNTIVEPSPIIVTAASQATSSAPTVVSATASTKPHLKTEEIDILRALGFDYELLRELGPHLGAFFDSLPSCSTDTSMLLKHECETAYFVLWSIMYKAQAALQARIPKKPAFLEEDAGFYMARQTAQSLFDVHRDTRSKLDPKDILKLFTVQRKGTFSPQDKQIILDLFTVVRKTPFTDEEVAAITALLSF